MGITLLTLLVFFAFCGLTAAMDCYGSRNDKYCKVKVSNYGWFVLKVDYCQDRWTDKSKNLLIWQSAYIYPPANSNVKLEAITGGSRDFWVGESDCSDTADMGHGMNQTVDHSWNAWSRTKENMFCEGTTWIGFRCLFY